MYEIPGNIYLGMNRVDVVFHATLGVELFLTYQAGVFPSMKVSLQRKTKNYIHPHKITTIHIHKNAIITKIIIFSLRCGSKQLSRELLEL